VFGFLSETFLPSAAQYFCKSDLKMLAEAVFSLGLHSVSALVAAFFTVVRILLWALLVCTTWYEIIEKPFETELRTKQPKTTDLDPAELTKVALEQHQAAKTVEQFENNKQAPLTPSAQSTTHLPHTSKNHASDMDDDESIDRWSFWEEENEAEKYAQQPRLPHERNKMVAETPSPTDRYTKVTQSLTTVPIGTRPAVTVTALEEGKRRHREEEVKKPFVARKLEQMFVTPYKEKCEIFCAF
jgi:hypothetical protein